MPYKEELKLSEVHPYILPDLRDFIEEILDLSNVYGDKIKMPVAYPPFKENDTFSYIIGASSTPIVYNPKNDYLTGVYQDEAIIRRSADTRLNKIIILKKLGIIHSILVSDTPLAKREVNFYLDKIRAENLLKEIEKIIEEKEKKEKEYERKKNEIYYNEKDYTINLEGKTPIRVSGWEDAICKAIFNPSKSKENEEIDAGEIIYEMTGEIYRKSQTPQYIEAIRQAVYRISKKIKKYFNKKDCLSFSTKTRKLTKT